MSTNSLWFWQQNRKGPMPATSVDFVHQTEISCSRGHEVEYLKIIELRDSYGFKMPGSVTCPVCSQRYMLINPTLEE